MTRYHFDLYPRTDPRDGSLIARLSDLQRAEYRGEANGAGVGLLSLRGDSSDGQLIDPSGLQYVRVVSDDTDKVVGGYFLDAGSFAAITRQNTRLLTFHGAGTLSYLDREVMWSHTYLTPGGMDPFDGLWRLYEQGSFAGGDFLGAVLHRVIYEAQHFQSGAYAHKHGDGTTHTDTHADDRTETAIPDLVLTFDGFEDSDGNPWTLPSGEFTAQVGESVYQVVQRLMRAGLYVEMDPDTFELRAWEAAGHRRDRTGGAFGASVVRFQAGSNIKSDSTRKIAAFIQRTAILASTSSDLAAVVTGPGAVPWHGGIRDDVEDVDALEQLATAQLSSRSDAADTVKLKIKLGADPTNGAYRPWEEVLPDDVVTVDSGSGQWDWDEQEFPVAALEVKLREAGDWDAFVELGASFSDASSRVFQASGSPLQQRLRLCDPDIPGTAESLTVYEHWRWGEQNANTPGSEVLAHPHLGGTVNAWGSHTPECRVPGSPTNGQTFACFLTATTGTTNSGKMGVSAGTELDISIIHGRYSPSYRLQVRWFSYPGGIYTELSRDTLFSGDPGSGWKTSTGRVVAPAGAVAFDIYKDNGAGLGVTVRFNEVTISTISAGSAGALRQGNIALVGTSSYAKRCDDTEHYPADRNPTVNDDASQGMRVNTVWVDTTTGEHWILLDNTTGAAVWLALGQSLHTHNASDVAYDGTTSGLAAVNVQDAIDEHLADAAAAHAASAISFTPNGSIAATDVQAAIQEVRDEAVGSSTSGEILISDAPSTPLIFADLVQNEDQNDLLYGD